MSTHVDVPAQSSRQAAIPARLATARDDARGQTARRIPWGLLAGHVMALVFGLGGLLIALPNPELWADSATGREVYDFGMTYAGSLHIVLGAAAMFAYGIAAIGLRMTAIFFAVTVPISLSSELLGTSTGLPFGDYQYTGLLGYRIAGLVPFPIPLSWFLMIYASLAICGRLLAVGDDSATRWRWALLGGAILTAWDVAMDPAMSAATSHWIWQQEGFFYGMPLINWFGWYVTGVLVSRAMLAIAPPSAFASRVSPAWLPVALYAINGVMPVAMTARAEMWWAAGLGALAMAVPVWLAVRVGRAATASDTAPANIPGGNPSRA